MISEVYFQDNMEYLSGIADKFFDLAYLDPNYGIGESSKNHKSRNAPVTQKNGSKMKAPDPIYTFENWDDNPADDDYFHEVFRTSKNQFIWGANYFSIIAGTPFKTPRRHEFQQFLIDNPTGWIIWDKVNGSNDFNDCELAWHSFETPSIILPFMWAGMLQGTSIQYGTIMQGNKKLNEKRIHPTQKPMPLNKWVLKTFSEPGEVIFDGGAGSQGSRIAAYEFGCIFYGCENNANNFALGNCRFADFLTHYHQPRLFTV